MNENVGSLAKDLAVECPRSPHETLGGFVIAARALDKCRADIAGTIGEYHYDCPLDNHFFSFAKITGDAYREFVATGASDEEVSQWIRGQIELSDDTIMLWNLRMRQTRITDLPLPQQLFLEGYIREFIPSNRRIYTWFDIYDIEEGVI